MDTLTLTNIQNNEIVTKTTHLPSLIVDAGEQAQFRFVEFFTATIRNLNTRKSYYGAVSKFCLWCELYGLKLEQVNPVHVATYIEQLGREVSIPTVKQNLSAISKLFDFLVTGHIIAINPAYSVTPPKYRVSKGKTPVLSAEDTRRLLQAIDTTKMAGLRDKAIIGVMVYSFARVGAVLRMNVDDYFMKDKRSWIRLHEKGSKYHEMPLHHKAEQYLEEYIQAAGISEDKKKPLFRALSREQKLTTTRLNQRDCLEMVKRRAKQAEISENICNHTFRGTGITVFLENGGSLEDAQRMANHSDVKTTNIIDGLTAFLLRWLSW